MRLVLDTNILMSALIVPTGFPDRLYQQWRGGRFILITSEKQLDEFRRVTRYPRLKPFLSPAAAGTMFNELRLLATFVTNLPLIDVSPDPDDNFLLAMAEAGQADYLVTRDKPGVLALGRHKNTHTVTVGHMVGLLEK